MKCLAIVALLGATGGSPQRAAAPAAAGWRDISVGIPPGDDISYLTFGRHPDEMYVGTRGGYVWHTADGGLTWMWIFRPLVHEPVAVPQLENLRAATVGDLGRGEGRDLPPRERHSESRRHADLAGSLREAPRERGAPLLGSIVRPELLDAAEVHHVTQCDSYLFVSTSQGLFRSSDGGYYFHPLHVGPTLDGWSESWVSCNPKRPGHLIVNGEGAAFESFDWGESFALYSNPLQRSPRLQTVTFDGEGRLLILFDGAVYRERPDRRGYDKICQFIPDGYAARKLRWAWWVSAGWTLGVTGDGVLRCEGEKASRLVDLRFGGELIRFIWIDEPHLDHILVATERAVYESFDGGASFALVFTAQTQRSIRRIVVSERPGDLVVVTGGQIYRRVAAGEAPREAERVMRRLTREVPLWEVVQTALGRVDLLPGDLAARRANIRMRALLPRLELRASYHDERVAARLLNRRAAMIDETATRRLRAGVWSVFAFWDLGDILHDALQSDPTWADLERLRAEVTYAVQDHYATWVRAQALLAEPDLSAWARAYHEVVRRHAAAYLHQMTGGAFPAFATGARQTAKL